MNYPMIYDFTMFDSIGMFSGVIPLLIVWSVVWKGLAVWVAARRNQPIWAIILLLFNTAGILEIIYLLSTDGFKEIKKS